MALAVRRRDVTGVTFHSDRGSEYIADLFADACRRLGWPVDGSGRALTAASESFHSTLKFELLRKQPGGVPAVQNGVGIYRNGRSGSV